MDTLNSSSLGLYCHLLPERRIIYLIMASAMARIEPGPLALQASASSITPWPLCQSLTSYIQTFNNSQKNKFSIKSQVATKTKKTFFFESFSHFFFFFFEKLLFAVFRRFLVDKNNFFSWKLGLRKEVYLVENDHMASLSKSRFECALRVPKITLHYYPCQLSPHGTLC